MTEDQIALVLKEIQQRKQELQELKKDIKEEEVIDTEEYMELKRTYKDLKAQVKDLEDRCRLELAKDEQYKLLKEMKVKKDEEIANLNKKLFELIAKLPPKFFQMNMETEEGVVKVQIQPEMRIYLNGKEEKKRA